MSAAAYRRFRPPSCAEHKQPCQHRDTSVSALCAELGISRTTLYRNITPDGQLTEVGQRALEDKRSRKTGKGRATRITPAHTPSATRQPRRAAALIVRQGACTMKPPEATQISSSASAADIAPAMSSGRTQWPRASARHCARRGPGRKGSPPEIASLDICRHPLIAGQNSEKK